MSINTVTGTYSSVLSSKKQDGKELFNADEVLDAYLTGKQDGINELNNNAIEWIKRNLSDCMKFLNELFEDINKRGIAFDGIFYNPPSPYSITLIVTVSEDDFLKDDFNDLYSFIHQLEENYNTDTLEICLSFIAKNEFYDEESIIEDGFIKIF